MAGLGIDESEVLPPQAAQYRIGPLRIPTSAYHEMPINYAGAGFAQYSCADLYAGRLSAQELHGKLVLIGVQLPGYPAEYKVPALTPKGVMADALIQANATDTLLRQRFITPLTIPYWLYPLPLIAATWVQARTQGRRRGLMGLLISGMIIALSILLFVTARLFFDPIILLIGSLLAAIGVTYLDIVRNMRRLRRLQAYAPPHLTTDSGQPAIKPEGEQRRIAILFADAKSFTALAERQDPRQVYQMMKQCMQILVDETYRAGGAIDKFTGDGIMSLFGVPQERPDDAERAVRAALNMQQALRRFNEEHSSEYEIPLQVRIGLNIGQVVVGDIGSTNRMNFTAMGDTVNVAARLEQCAEPGAILVSEAIQQATAHRFVFRALGPLQLKNRTQPVNTYQVLGPRPNAPR